MSKPRYIPYFEKLKDPRWQRRRLEILERDGWACTICADTEKTLHVHHRYYKPKTDPWDYEDDALTTLCADCHEYTTNLTRRAQSLMGQVGINTLIEIVAYMEAVSARNSGEGVSVLSYEEAIGVGAAYCVPPEAVLAVLPDDKIIDERRLSELQSVATDTFMDPDVMDRIKRTIAERGY